MAAQVLVEAGVISAADRALREALAGRPLVSAERFCGSLRTAYAGPGPVEAARPTVAVGCYPAWTAAAPCSMLAAEERTGVRGPDERRSWEDALEGPARALLAGLARRPVISAWYATDRLRTWAGLGGTVAAVDGRLRAVVEDKAAFTALLTAAGVPQRMRIPAVRIDGALPVLGELQSMVGSEQLVVQCGADSGGRGTTFVTTGADLEVAARMPGPYKVAAFVVGWSSNTTVLTVPTRRGVAVYVDRPSHKAVGVAEAGIGPGKSAGNDWSRPWPARAATDLVDAAVRVGEFLWREHRVAGLFGLDAILTPDGAVMFNEINLRNQGTTEVSGVNQQLRGLPPFVVAHLTVLLGGRAHWLPAADEFNAATIATATRSVPGPYYLKLRHRGPNPVRVTGLHGPGIYRITDGRLAWVRPGAHPADAAADTGEVLLASLPDERVVCLPDAELGTAEALTTGRGSPFAEPHALSSFGRSVLDALGRQLEPATEPTTAR